VDKGMFLLFHRSGLEGEKDNDDEQTDREEHGFLISQDGI
jgi:hypothetical protein